MRAWAGRPTRALRKNEKVYADGGLAQSPRRDAPLEACPDFPQTAAKVQLA
jgi:hypothetical protein